MLADLFKPAWESPSVEKRLKAIHDMDSDSAEHQKILIQLAADDEDVSIRIAAIRRVTTVAALHELSLKLSDADVRSEAEKKVNELLGTNRALDEEQYRDILKHYPELQIRLAAFADSSAVRSDVMRTSSSGQLLEILGNTAYTDSRQLIAEKLSNIEDLESARKIMRGKDKNAERIIKTKIDAFRSHERQQAENLSRLQKLIDEVEYLANHDWLPEFKARCLAHRREWDELEFEIDEDARLRYQKSREIVDSNYDHQRTIEQTRESQLQLVNDLESLLNLSADRGLADSIEALSESQSRQDQFDLDWAALGAINPPQESLSKRYDKMRAALQSASRLVASAEALVKTTGEDSGEDPGETVVNDDLADKGKQLQGALKKLKWPAEFPELRVATELRQQLQDWREIQKAAVAEHEENLARVHKHISAVFRFSRAGNLGRAKQSALKVQKSLAKFDGKELIALQERFDEASKTLGDMGDWKNFATEPKYLELCESMELLTTSKFHPDKLTTEMKALQQQWKELGHSDISDQYWPRFKLAADKVYQPCAEFFKKRHDDRKANLEQRQQYVEQMRELLEATDWDNNPDYKAAQSSVRNITDRFIRIKDVERNPGQKQWKKLTSYKDAVMAKLEIAYEANISLKQQIVKQTEALAQATARVENLDTLKMLQARWKQIGVTRRDQDQKAWGIFKQQGDIVYNKVQEMRQGQREETDQQLDAYRKIIKEIQNLAKTASDLAAADHQFAEFQDSYNALPELPRQLPEKLVEGIQRDYRKACDQYDNCHTRIIKNRHNQQIDALRSKAGLCALQEALGPSPSAQQLQELSQQWDAIELLDADLLRRIEARRETAQSAIDRTAVGAERRMLCIQLEIATGVESPDEDRALRMQYQLEQMNKSGLGQQTVINKEMLKKLEIDWLCMPGAESAQQKALDERFQRILRSA